MLQKRNNAESTQSATKAKGKLFYGWVVAIAGAGVIIAAVNFQYSFGVFIKPLINKFGWSRAAIAGSVSARSIVSGLISPIAGGLSDRYGPRRFILTGIFMVGVSYLLTSRVTSLWQLYLFFSILNGIGTAAIFTPVLATVTKWFGGKSALANGIVMSGFGMTQVIIPPVATYLIVRYSWETTFIVLGVAAWGLGTVAWHFIRTPPNIMKQPQGKPAGEREDTKTSENPTGVEKDYTLSEVLRTRTFWLLFLIFVVVATSYQMLAIHIVIAAIDTGITPEAAAIILTLGGITNVLGRLTLGGLASKIGNRIVLAPCLLIQALALFFLAGASDLHIFYIIATVYGLAYGGVTPIVTTMAGRFFGTRSIGSIIGTLFTAYTIGVGIGPLLAGYIFDVTGSYFIAFFSAAIAMAITFLFSLLLKPPQRKSLAA